MPQGRLRCSLELMLIKINFSKDSCTAWHRFKKGMLAQGVLGCSNSRPTTFSLDLHSSHTFESSQDNFGYLHRYFASPSTTHPRRLPAWLYFSGDQYQYECIWLRCKNVENIRRDSILKRDDVNKKFNHFVDARRWEAHVKLCESETCKCDVSWH